ncbi:MAG: fatty acid desaturase [Bacteroidetes bacterium]|nr:fatty acid desaturase [Bacteroidota bacterium]
MKIHSFPHNPTTSLSIALLIILLWTGSLVFMLSLELTDASLWFWLPLFILIQTHLFTGLFITAHDAMHHLITPSLRLNHAIGWICSLLFMFNRYDQLYPKHHDHHRYPATDRDPDFATGGFFRWYGSFVRQYVTVFQILAVAVLFNLLALWIPQTNLILFWVIPSVLSTIQLFYFGTYLPHRGTHPADNPHKARSFTGGPAAAFFTCYFFGYHYEHHDRPYLAWWRLATARIR